LTKEAICLRRSCKVTRQFGLILLKETIYPVDEWIIPAPGCGPFAVCQKKLEDARGFEVSMWGYGFDTTVYACEYGRSEHHMLFTPQGRDYRLERPTVERPFDEFKRLRDVTDFASAIRLIKRA